MGAFVAFYWTFPVRWAGFLDLPDDAARAAEASRTVAYQRALARRFVEWENGSLVHEVAAMEVSPDRGTFAIEGDVARAGRLCREADATLLHVDFHKNGGWRPHPFLGEALSALRGTGVPVLGLPADAIMLDGRPFDPAEHFSLWRVRDAEERDRRRREVPAALAAALAEVPEGRGRWKAVAGLLNEREVPTFGGGTTWTPDNVRKAAKDVEEFAGYASRPMRTD
ncbi:hypothetical protein [Methylobacterium radiodurans]|uniref:Uncharacterized protein n=1 Tax=Methylobacterium radiodurans TaxID=2202828 RepID=A0A2U8VL62_9HYPH|nr:hypothetical protein [Methylobacterium radiodurans]AWN34389.1 hypothetical protein DK427_00385 [Methylobacterium radiodurans]